MKLGYSTSATFPFSLEKSFQIGAAAGYEWIEVMITSDKKTRDAKYLMSLEEKYGVEIVSFHAPTLLLTHFTWGTDPETKLLKTAELTAEVGGDTVVVHPPFSWQKSSIEGFLDSVVKTREETGITVAVENMFPWRLNERERVMYKPSWKDTLDSGVPLTYDFSHAALSGWSSLNQLQEILPDLAHIHLCDGKGTAVPGQKDKVFDEHLLPGKGNQNVAECLQFLKRSNWTGNIVAEIKTSRQRTASAKATVLKQTLEWTKHALNAA